MEDKHKAEREMCRDVQRDHCRMRERGLRAEPVGLEHGKSASEKARLSSPPQAFDLATRPTSAENPISVEKAAPFSSRNYALRGSSPTFRPFPAFSGRRAAPGPAHALCSAYRLPRQPRGRPRSFGKERLALPERTRWCKPTALGSSSASRWVAAGRDWGRPHPPPRSQPLSCRSRTIPFLR